MPDHLNDPELFDLVKTYQVYVHRRTCWKYYKNECHFLYGRYFIEKTIITKPLDSKFSNEEKQKVLTWRNTLLRQTKSYFDNAKVNVILPRQFYSVRNELEISKEGYYRTLSIAKEENLELNLKREPNSCFVNKLF